MCGIVGVVGNILLAAAAFSTPRLRTKSGVLLGTLAISDIFLATHNLVLSFSYALLLFRAADVSFSVCVWLLAMPIALLTSIDSILILAIALDRILMIKAPVFYKQASLKKYLGFWLSIAFCQVIFHIIPTVFGVTDDYYSYRICDPMLLYTPLTLQLSLPFHASICCIVLLTNSVSVTSVEERGKWGRRRSEDERIKRFRRSVRSVSLVYASTWGLLVLKETVVMAINGAQESGGPLSSLRLFSLTLSPILGGCNFWLFLSMNPCQCLDWPKPGYFQLQLLHLLPEERRLPETDKTADESEGYR